MANIGRLQWNGGKGCSGTSAVTVVDLKAEPIRIPPSLHCNMISAVSKRMNYRTFQLFLLGICVVTVLFHALNFVLTCSNVTSGGSDRTSSNHHFICALFGRKSNPLTRTFPYHRNDNNNNNDYNNNDNNDNDNNNNRSFIQHRGLYNTQQMINIMSKNITNHRMSGPFNLRIPTKEQMTKPKLNFDAFRTAMTDSERQSLLSVFRRLLRICRENNITILLYGGSLLGSYRHHDVIPWDDDIDVMMNSSQKETISKILLSSSSSSSPSSFDDERNFQFYRSNTSRIASKFFNRRSHTNDTSKSSHLPFQWPYVDIFFFEENSTHIYDELPQYKSDFVFPKTQIFPLVLRPFAGESVPAPYDTKSVLDKNYSPLICKAPLFSHRLESAVKRQSRSLPCKHLHGFHPFVFREKVPVLTLASGQQKMATTNKGRYNYNINRIICKRNETLRLGPKVLQTVSVQTNLCGYVKGVGVV